MRYGTVDRDFAMRLAACPPEQDGPVMMVNFMKYRDVASYRDAQGEQVTGREADDRYAPIDVLHDIGAKIIFAGEVVDERGEPEPTWDRVAIVVYPTRRSFIEMQSRKDFQERHVHKEAGMAFTIVLAAVPAGPVNGSAGGTDGVRLVAWPEGTDPDPGECEGALLGVEGRIIGDERRWGHLGIHFSSGDDLPAPPGVMVVRTRPMIDRIRETIDQWPGT